MKVQLGLQEQFQTLVQAKTLFGWEAVSSVAIVF